MGTRRDKCIWCLIKEVLRVAPDYGAAQNLAFYGWSAVGTAVLAMLIYIGALICSHLSAFRVQANMRSQLMRHILSLPLGFMEEEGSGKIRKIVNESSCRINVSLSLLRQDLRSFFLSLTGDSDFCV